MIAMMGRHQEAHDRKQYTYPGSKLLCSCRDASQMSQRAEASMQRGDVYCLGLDILCRVDACQGIKLFPYLKFRIILLS